MTISLKSRQRIRKRAKFVYEYCHSSEEASAFRFTFDHLVPQSLGEKDTEENLAVACHHYNGRRYNFTEKIAPATQVRTPLFTSRQDKCLEYFT